MERSRRQRLGPPSSSSSSSTRPRSYRNSAPNHTRNVESPHATHDAPGSVQSRTAGQDVDDSSDLPVLVGTCPFMCPVGERDQRERLRDLAVFERLHGNRRKTSPDLAVKKFCRTISVNNLQPSDVRPLPVLEETLDYLLSLLDSTEHPFQVIHDFIFDRTRSIRQDLTMQNIVNERVICMYEKMVKFHVISLHKLRSCSSDPNASSVYYLSMEQLMKTLTSLFNLYAANRSPNTIYENEAMFNSYYVLLHLGSDCQPMGESLSSWLRRVPKSIIKSKEMCFARRLLCFLRMGNYRRFLLSTAAKASYLQYCIIEPYVSEVRAMALKYINHGGYKLHPYPLAHLSKLLMMEESDLLSFCKACGLETCTDELGNNLLPTKQTTLCTPKGGFQSCGISGFQPFER